MIDGDGVADGEIGLYGVSKVAVMMNVTVRVATGRLVGVFVVNGE